MSVSRTSDQDGETLFTETQTVQARNIDVNAADGEGALVRGGTEELQRVVTDTEPFSPERGEEWKIWQIVYSLSYRWEDDSSDNLSESLSAQWALSETGDVLMTMQGGGNLEALDSEAGVISTADFSAEGAKNDDVWISEAGEVTAAMHNTADGNAGGGTYYHWVTNGVWEPPKPITIGSRTSLDQSIQFMGPFATSQGDVQAVFGSTVTVWYESRDTDEPFR